MFIPLILLLLPCFNVAEDGAEKFSYDEGKWQNAANHLIEGLNKNVKPCEDFFQHVCGNIDWKNIAGLDRELAQRQTKFDEMGARVIKQIDTSNPNTPDYKRNLRLYFDGCVELQSEPGWEEKIFDALFQKLYIKKEAAYDNNKFGWKLLGMLERHISPSVFYKYIVSDGPASTFFSENAWVKQMHDMKFLSTLHTQQDQGIKGKLMNMEVWNPMQALVDRNLSDQIPKIIELEGELSIAAPPGSRKYSDIEEISSKAPNFQWDHFLEGMIQSRHIKEFKKHMKLWMDAPDLKIMDNYGKAFEKAGIEVVSLLAIISSYFKFAFVGAATPEQICMTRVKINYAPALTRVLLDAQGRDGLEVRYQIFELVGHIFSSLRFLLSTVEWLEPADKEGLNRKLDEIIVDPGLPEWINDDAEISRRVPTYDPELGVFQNHFKGRKYIFDSMVQRMLDGTFVSEPYNGGESYPCTTIGANYNEAYKYMDQAPRIHVHAAFDFPPFFDNDYPTAFKYGGLGMVIAHEVMHAFGPNAINNPLLDGSNPVQKKSLKEYTEATECLKVDYGKYSTKNRAHCVDGSFTLNENVADISGLKVAYLAYKILSQLHGEDLHLPGNLRNYTNDQIFFMTHARLWCEAGYENSAEQYAKVKDKHAPGVARIEVAYRHVSQFAAAFSCPVNSKYAPIKKCDMWGEIANAAQHEF